MRVSLVLATTLLAYAASAQPLTVAEKLGYPKNSKLLIIHGDDIGVSHSQNAATIRALEHGNVTSGSIMVPCPWFPEIADYVKSHPDSDLGLHLTLTSEWKLYKWGPVTPRTEVPSLIDDKGFFYDNVLDLIKHAKVDEVEKELRSQIDRAIAFGINPTHFDGHMGAAFSNPEYLKVYIKLSREYKVPVLLNHEAFKIMFNLDLKTLIDDKDVVADGVFMASEADFKKGMKHFYPGVFSSLQPGLNVILLHAAYDNDEMQAVTVDHPAFGAAWRQADFDFFTSGECRRLLKENNIQLITWKEIRDKLYR
ncbi:MAG TPA: polysaccharide deacetylase family protein [Cyclobacteriaceae bacterium]|nr:polysaccharide deacetylase family protein [Cyclobacteriaceae bacterium]